MPTPPFLVYPTVYPSTLILGLTCFSYSSYSGKRKEIEEEEEYQDICLDLNYLKNEHILSLFKMVGNRWIFKLLTESYKRENYSYLNDRDWLIFILNEYFISIWNLYDGKERNNNLSNKNISNEYDYIQYTDKLLLIGFELSIGKNPKDIEFNFGDKNRKIIHKLSVYKNSNKNINVYGNNSILSVLCNNNDNMDIDNNMESMQSMQSMNVAQKNLDLTMNKFRSLYLEKQKECDAEFMSLCEILKSYQLEQESKIKRIELNESMTYLIIKNNDIMKEIFDIDSYNKLLQNAYYEQWNEYKLLIELLLMSHQNYFRYLHLTAIPIKSLQFVYFALKWQLIHIKNEEYHYKYNDRFDINITFQYQHGIKIINYLIPQQIINGNNNNIYYINSNIMISEINKFKNNKKYQQWGYKLYIILFDKKKSIKYAQCGRMWTMRDCMDSRFSIKIDKCSGYIIFNKTLKPDPKCMKKLKEISSIFGNKKNIQFSADNNNDDNIHFNITD